MHEVFFKVIFKLAVVIVLIGNVLDLVLKFLEILKIL